MPLWIVAVSADHAGSSQFVRFDRNALVHIAVVPVFRGAHVWWLEIASRAVAIPAT